MLADIVVFDGLDELDALGPYEILRRAGQLSIDFSVRLVTHTGQRSVCAASGLTFETDGTFIPGEAEMSSSPVAAGTPARNRSVAEYQKGELAPLLVEAAKSATVMGRVCTEPCCGPRRRHHRSPREHALHAHEELAELGVVVVPDRVVDDGDLLPAAASQWTRPRVVVGGARTERSTRQQIAKSIEYKWFDRIVR